MAALLDGTAHAFGVTRCTLRRGVHKNEKELLSPVTGQKVVRSGQVAQGIGDDAQHIVTSLMTERVVEALEVVDIEQPERKDPSRLGRLPKAVVKKSVERAPVVEPG